MEGTRSDPIDLTTSSDFVCPNCPHDEVISLSSDYSDSSDVSTIEMPSSDESHSSDDEVSEPPLYLRPFSFLRNGKRFRKEFPDQ